MIFLYRAKLVILSQPKTGTTALDHALGPRASIAINNPPELKHLRYRKFLKFVAPMIKAQTGLGRADYEIVSVMREPIDWLGSWYRYRSRDDLKDAGHHRAANYAGKVSFDDFVREVCKPNRERAAYANVGSPCSVALDGKDCVGVDRIYPYEDLSGLFRLIEERTGKPVETRVMNASPAMKISLSDEARALVQSRQAFAFDLHRSLRPDGAIDPRFRIAPERGEDDDED